MTDASVRRNLQQAKHCIEEALSVLKNNEPTQQAIDDAEQAAMLLTEIIIPALLRFESPG